MPGRPEVAPGRDLEQFADVDDERSLDGRDRDPTAGGRFDFEPLGAGFDQQQGEHSRVLVRTHALGAVGGTRVANHLDQGRR